MFYTGWGKFYHTNRDKYYGNTQPITGGKWRDDNGNSVLHWPGASPALAEWLIKERYVNPYSRAST